MITTFAPRGIPGAYEPDVTPAIHERHNEQAPLARVADDDRPRFLPRVVGIIENVGERILERGRSLLEADPVRLEVGNGLVRIPLEGGSDHPPWKVLRL